ncbi:tetratricopeptide repeat protein [Streptomyces ferrugineus]|uniref:Tetratricopeptide repeat protein n=1 Tax=Streptomyces ferrugineus TaxID=1413221 RepID=A0A7M2SCL8_9ACTN|nr:FxSxx-COOH system tetratricopeptide repeat protein [Streptomyces ferrugineus]QOV33515.1 tetratricopeptide repeat protein [Streptomyces ferrugineus]
MTHDDHGRGTIITFYSFKGGTGRTMALVNTAWILASNGLRVLVVDWDLEAPGLHTYLQPLLADPELTESAGVIEMVQNFAREATAHAVGSRAEAGDATTARPPSLVGLREHARVDQYVVGTDLRLPPGGRLDLLPAGAQDPDTYAVTVSTFDWGKFYRMGGNNLLTALREDMAARYDYVLIDSRTGFSDTAGICTVVLPDIVVDCFTLSRQGVNGAVRVAESIRRNSHAQRNIRIVPVPMRVEDAGRDRLEAGRYQARSLFSPFLHWMPEEEYDDYWNSVEIPYKASYAYEEIPATVGERRQDGTLLAAFERLTARITDNRVIQLSNMPETYRQRLRREYERNSPVNRKDFYVSYAAPDRLWADWAAAAFRAAGFEAKLAPVETTDLSAASTALAGLERTLAGESRLVVLLSSQYTALKEARDTWQRVSRRDSNGENGMIIPVHVDDSSLPPEFTTASPAVSLVGVSTEEAVLRLLAAADGEQPGSGARHVAASAIPSTRLPGTPPKVSRLPQRNAVFTGRRALIERLRDSLLSGGSTAVLPQALYGLGGVGKTQIALEYAHRFASDYDVVWWINAAERQQIRQDLSALGARLGVATGGKDLRAICNEVLDRLRRGAPHSRWLLVYDNAEKAGDLDELIPVSGSGRHVLITSRNPGWDERAARLEVDLFTREESVALLRRYNRGLERVEADRVAEELGDFPLAVSLAAASLQQSALPVDTYVEMLRSQMTDILRSQPAPEYPSSAAATWLLSLNQLRERMPAAAALLQVCAFFGPDPIPRSLLNNQTSRRLLQHHDPSLANLLMMGRLYGEIKRNGLAQIDERADTLTLHRLVQRVLRDQLSAEEQGEMRERVHSVLGEGNPNNPDDSANWSHYAALLPHLRPTQAEESDKTEVRQWICDTVRYLWRSGDAATADQTAERVLGTWTSLFGDDDELVLQLRTELGNALRDQGRLSKAFSVTRDAYERGRRVLGEDHPYTLNAAMSLGADLRGAGRYEEAMESDRDTLERARRVYTDSHPRTLSAANNLAVSEFLSGNREAARNTNRDIFKQRQEISGPDERSTLNSATNYARDLRAAGEFHEALKLIEDTLERSRRTLGNEHLITFRASLGAAILYRRLGDSEKAYALTSETYDQCRKQLGDDHPDTLAVATNLCSDRYDRGDAVEGRDLAKDTFERYQRRFGEDHVFTLASATNLAILLRLTGEREEALRLSAQALDRLRGLLGPRHPYTLTCMLNHATDLSENDRHPEAVGMAREASEGLEAVLGPNHYLTIAGASNLAAQLRQDEPDEARRLHDEAEGRARESKELGGEHPMTRSVTAWRPIDADIEPPVT